MTHALQRKPIDICIERREPQVVLGNAGVVQVIQVGSAVKSLRPEQRAIIFCVGEEDWFGYPRKILGFDAAGTMGCLAKRMVLRERQLIPLPRDTKYSMEQWAAFSLRYVTAWSNWRVAHGTYRLQVTADELAAINVWGWGGGVSLAELELARLHGARAVLLSHNDANLAYVAKTRVEAVDHRQFGNLFINYEKYYRDPETREAYKRAETAFCEEVRRRTDGRMVQIFCDYIGKPVVRATLAALSRQGVLTTAGWKEGMDVSLLRAKECIERHQHIHTHYARYPEGWQAVAFAEANGWLPHLYEKVYSFEDVPRLAEDYAEGKTGYFPLFAINA